MTEPLIRCGACGRAVTRDDPWHDVFVAEDLRGGQPDAYVTKCRALERLAPSRTSTDGDD